MHKALTISVFAAVTAVMSGEHLLFLDKLKFTIPIEVGGSTVNVLPDTNSPLSAFVKINSGIQAEDYFVPNPETTIETNERRQGRYLHFKIFLDTLEIRDDIKLTNQSIAVAIHSNTELMSKVSHTLGLSRKYLGPLSFAKSILESGHPSLQKMTIRIENLKKNPLVQVGGVLILGDDSFCLCDNNNRVTVKAVTDDRWLIPIEKLGIRENPFTSFYISTKFILINNSTKLYAVITPSTPGILLPNSIYKKFLAEYGVNGTVEFAANQLLPTLEIYIGGRLFRIPPRNYVKYKQGGNSGKFLLRSTAYTSYKENEIVLGRPFLYEACLHLNNIDGTVSLSTPLYYN